MSKNKAAKAYEKSLIDAYYDMRMRRMLDPLYEAFQKWKKGEMQHDELAELIHKVHQENQEIYKLFTMGRDWLIVCIRADAEWFARWQQDNPLPTGLEL
jgi:hypothetical protein